MPRVHCKCLSVNTIPLVQTKTSVIFTEQFAAVHALPLPGQMPGQYSDNKTLTLPSYMSVDESL